jgi:hypothetical protein
MRVINYEKGGWLLRADFVSLFNSTQEGNRNKAVGPNFSLNIVGNLHLTRKDHCCKYIFQFVTAETHKWRLFGT